MMMMTSWEAEVGGEEWICFMKKEKRMQCE
jgi:hypothetical protein